MEMIKKISLLLLVVGGLNWLLVGLFGWDIGAIFCVLVAIVSRIVYILVGLSAILTIVYPCKCCEVKGEEKVQTQM